MKRAKAEASETAAKSKAKPSPASSKSKAKAPTGAGWFNDFDLKGMGVPEEAFPQPDRNHAGKHGYTVVSENGAAPRV